MKKRRAPFTLVELLVVIAVIGVLASLLLPALSKAKERATTLKCVGNLRQSGVLLTSYAQDWNGMMPYNSWTAGAYSYWASLLKNQGGYVQSYKSLYCPLTQSLAEKASAPYALSYGMNTGAYGSNCIDVYRTNMVSDWGHLKAVLNSPSTFTVLADNGNSASVSGGIFSPNYILLFPRYRWPTSGTSSTLRAYRRHGGVLANVLLLDGHASSFTKRALVDELKFEDDGIY